MPLYAGACETNITPPVGVWMSGYAYRPSGSVGVHDELYARALVFANGDTMAALLSTDLIGLDFDLVDRVRAGVEAATGIPAAGVMINSTHTHGGPSTRVYNSMGPPDGPYVDVLVRKLVGIAKQAANSLQPATVVFGRAPVQVGVNRRQTTAAGRTHIGANYAGPVDTGVRALIVRDSRGHPFAVAFTHACHGTTLGGENLLTTGDWCGYACEGVRDRTDGHVMPMFLQGCCGNINPHPRGSFDLARRHGETVAAAVVEAMSAPQAVRLADATEVHFDEAAAELPLIPPPDIVECRTRLDAARADLAEARNAGQVGRTMHAEGMVRYAETVLALREAGGPFSTRFTLQRLTVAGGRLLGMPAEAVVQYSLDFERQSRAPVLALGYTNGIHNYLPAAADYALGGYEVDSAHVYYNSLMFTPECEQLVRAAAYELLDIEHPSWVEYRV